MSKNAPLKPNTQCWGVSHKWTAYGYRYDLDKNWWEFWK